MDKKRAEFLTRLRETFRVEAAEHVDAIRSGLLSLDGAGDAARATIVERIFREAHSLKGAARSVSLGGVEALCQELESVFAGMKRGEIRASAETLARVRPALDALADQCGDPGAPSTQERHEEAQRALLSLERARLGAEPEATASAAPLRASSPRASPAAVAPDTVRVAVHKLTAIFLEAEELVGAKLAASSRAAELRALALELAGRNQRRVRNSATARQGRNGAAALAEGLEAERLHVKALEGSLRKLAALAHQDAVALTAVSDRLLEDTKKLLLLPCSYLLASLPHVVRDLARQQGKEADLVVGGEDIEIDRRVLDELRDPIIHLLRNSVDHGIESPEARRALGKPGRGLVRLTAKPVEGNRVELELSDDGSGIHWEKVAKVAVRLGLLSPDGSAHASDEQLADLVFHSGLSTSPIITDLSGRGLGLAIVREKVEKLGGAIALSTKLGGGTTFLVTVPVSLSTFRGVLVGVAGRRFVIPTANVVRVDRVDPREIESIEGRATIALGGRAVSLVRLRDVLELSEPDVRTNGALRPLVLVRAAGREVAFLLDTVEGEQEVLVKSLGSQLPRVRNVAGGCLSGSGAVIPILEAADLVESARKASLPDVVGALTDVAPERRARVLIAEDSITARTLVKSILEGEGYEVTACVDGMDALTQLKTEPFDLVVSDVDMPRMSGFELTAKIRADSRLGDLPVVLVTALGSQADREYGIEVGANAYIVKSDFDQSNLLEIIRRLL